MTTYDAIATAAQGFAAWLVNEGVARHDRVALWLPNGIAWVVAHVAVAATGAAEKQRPAGTRIASHLLLGSGAAQRAQPDHNGAAFILRHGEGRHLCTGDAGQNVAQDVGIRRARLPAAGRQIGTAPALGFGPVTRRAVFLEQLVTHLDPGRILLEGLCHNNHRGKKCEECRTFHPVNMILEAGYRPKSM